VLLLLLLVDILILIFATSIGAILCCCGWSSSHQAFATFGAAAVFSAFATVVGGDLLFYWCYMTLVLVELVE
jgi:hypothetical protein